MPSTFNYAFSSQLESLVRTFYLANGTFLDFIKFLKESAAYVSTDSVRIEIEPVSEKFGRFRYTVWFVRTPVMEESLDAFDMSKEQGIVLEKVFEFISFINKKELMDFPKA